MKAYRSSPMTEAHLSQIHEAGLFAVKRETVQNKVCFNYSL